MSSVPPPVPAATPAHAPDSPNEITIVSHSNLYYWWPVWAIGFLMGLLTWVGGYVAAIVPGKPPFGDANSSPVAKSDWKLEDGSTREGVLIVPQPDPYKKEKA